jgi:hypothetical protein
MKWRRNGAGQQRRPRGAMRRRFSLERNLGAQILVDEEVARLRADEAVAWLSTYVWCREVGLEGVRVGCCFVGAGLRERTCPVRAKI